jgi:uncharacterized membrane protein (DUF2068 family)
MATNRPVAITVICIIGFVGVALAVPVLLAALAAGAGSILPTWYWPYLLVSIVVGLVALIGLWKMKKWGAYLYTAMFLINQCLLLATGLWSVGALIIPLIVVVIALSQLSKMD